MTRRALVLAIGPLPPPMHGFALVHQSSIQALRSFGFDVVTANTSGGGLERGAPYHIRRWARYLSAILMLLRFALTPGRIAFIGVDAGVGMIYSLVLVLVARLTGYRLVFAHHSSHYVTRRRTLASLLFGVAGQSACHIALSFDMKEHMIAHYGPELQVVVVDNTAWCASSEKRTSGGSSDGEIRIGFLSNLSREKGLDIAIAVADAGRTAGLPLRLVLAGPTADAAAAESVRRATESMPDTIEYRGYVSGEEKERFFGDIDLFLFPSQYQNEAQPIVLLEAMSRKIPVIASNVGFIPWLIEPCGTILPAGPAFRDAALSHLRYLAENREVLSSLGQAAKARFDDLKGHSESAFRAIFESSLRTSPVAS